MVLAVTKAHRSKRAIPTAKKKKNSYYRPGAVHRERKETMTVYESITRTIESFQEDLAVYGENSIPAAGLKGMILGAQCARDRLTVEAAACEV